MEVTVFFGEEYKELGCCDDDDVENETIEEAVLGESIDKLSPEAEI